MKKIPRVKVELAFGRPGALHVKSVSEPEDTASPRSRKANTLATVHTHQLLVNLKAMQNNALHAPAEVVAGYIASRDEWAPRYRAELDRRGVDYPKTLDAADWEIALAKALGLDEPRPRLVGRRDAKSGKMMTLTEVWDASRRSYVVRQ